MDKADAGLWHSICCLFEAKLKVNQSIVYVKHKVYSVYSNYQNSSTGMEKTSFLDSHFFIAG